MQRVNVGDWVEVRGKEEILGTLDRNGQLDGMPFMPEMLQFCGRRFRVYKSAHKTCDTVFPIRGRRVDRTVHLEARCDGSAHGGCQASCLLFWKEAWLKPVPDQSATVLSDLDSHDTSERIAKLQNAGCTELDIWSKASTSRTEDGVPIYTCQATRLPYATTDLKWWDIRQYAKDYTSGNVGLWQIICGIAYSAYYHLSQAGIGVGRPMRWLYEKLRPLRGGYLWPRRAGTIPRGERTPGVPLNLQPGEFVRIKSHEEILRTLDTAGQNRGMSWDAEMVPYCGGTYQVLKRVTKFINEKTGEMQEMKNPGIILNSVICLGKYSYCRMFCPRSIYSWWREIWLERVEVSDPVMIAGKKSGIQKQRSSQDQDMVTR